MNNCIILNGIRRTIANGGNLEACEVEYLIGLIISGKGNTIDRYIHEHKIRLLQQQLFSNREVVVNTLVLTYNKYKNNWMENVHQVTKLLDLTIALVYPTVLLSMYSSQEKSKFNQEATSQYAYFSSNSTMFFNPDYDSQTIMEYLRGSSFVDVGCGFMDKVLLLGLLTGARSTGIEYDYYPGIIGYKLITNTIICYNYRPQIYLIHDDAFKVKYSEYDRIYTYIPLRQEDALMKLYIHIASSIKKGTMWFEYGYPLPLDKSSKLKKLLTPVGGFYIKN